MFGLFQLFGRSRELKAVDHALREAGVHPGTVPEAVKLTVVRLLKQEASAGARVPESAIEDATQLLGYCMLGHDQFVASNSSRAAERAEARIEAAIAAGDSLDAKLVLLALHSGVIVSEVADRFDVETGDRLSRRAALCSAEKLCLKQTRIMSLVEAIANVVVGYGIAVLTRLLVFPWFGLPARVGDALAIGLIFTTLCGAPHKQVYAERMIMRSGPGRAAIRD